MILENDEQQASASDRYIGGTDEMPPQIHHADRRSENIPVFLVNDSGTAAGNNSANIPAFLQDDQSYTKSESVEVSSPFVVFVPDYFENSRYSSSLFFASHASI